MKVVRPFGSVVMTLSTDQQVMGSISGFAMGFFSSENYSTLLTDWVFV